MEIILSSKLRHGNESFGAIVYRYEYYTMIELTSLRRGLMQVSGPTSG